MHGVVSHAWRSSVFPASLSLLQLNNTNERLTTEKKQHVSADNSETAGQKDLRFGQIVYILVFYNISFSWLLPLGSFQYFFWCSVNCVTVKAIYSFNMISICFQIFVPNVNRSQIDEMYNKMNIAKLEKLCSKVRMLMSSFISISHAATQPGTEGALLFFRVVFSSRQFQIQINLLNDMTRNLSNLSLGLS